MVKIIDIAKTQQLFNVIQCNKCNVIWPFLLDNHDKVGLYYFLQKLTCKCGGTFNVVKINCSFDEIYNKISLQDPLVKEDFNNFLEINIEDIPEMRMKLLEILTKSKYYLLIFGMKVGD